MDEKQLKILLMFGADAGKADAELKKLNEKFVSLSKRAEALRASLKMFQELGQDTKSVERELQAVEAEMNRVADATRKAVSEIKGMSQGVRDARDNLYQLRDIGEKLSQVGQYIGNAGNAILSPLMQASQLFLSTAAQNDPLVVRWKSEMGEIQNAWLRIGRVATEELLPILEKTSEFADKLADFIERNPELIKIALGAGAGLAVAGQGLQIIGSTAMLLGSLKQMGWLGAGGAAAGGGAFASGATALGQVALTATTVYLSASFGKWLGNEINKMLYGPDVKEQTWGDIATTAGQLMTLPAFLVAKLFGTEKQVYELAEKTNPLLIFGNYLKGLEEKNQPQQNTLNQPIVTQSQLDAFAAWEDAQNKRKEFEATSETQRTQLVQQYAEQRAKLEQTYEIQRNDIVAQYAEQRARLATSYAQNEQRAEQDYYRQRLSAAEKYGVMARRAEEDHQRELLKLQQQHDRRVYDLLAERDALGLIREQEAYENQRREAEDQHRIEMMRRSEDFGAQLSEMESNFALLRARRAQDYQQQLADLAVQEQKRLELLATQQAEALKRLDEDHAEKMRRLEEQSRRELDMLRQVEQNRLNILRALALNDQSALEQAGIEMMTRFRTWLQQAAGSLALPGILPSGGGKPLAARAEGGWVNAGTSYLVGERGAEMFIPHTSGHIIPNHRILANEHSAGYAENASSIMMRIETASLTLAQVSREIDHRLKRNNRVLADALGGQYG